MADKIPAEKEKKVKVKEDKAKEKEIVKKPRESKDGKEPKEPKDKKIEDKYQKKTQIEHILLRPDSYIGSSDEEKEKLWVYQQSENKLVYKEILYVPGLYKIFDEILVNAADHYTNNSNTMNYIKVKIDPSIPKISVENNGPGIPVVIHKTHGVYVPELIFGHLLTSTNYDDSVQRTTGGRNGYGAKLTNIFSKEFIIETLDTEYKKEYKQVFRNNMSIMENPIIKDVNDDKKSYTRITFVPDLSRFHLKSLSDDFYSLLVKRVYDLAGVTDSGLKVYLNGEQIKIKSFENYVKLYLDSASNDSDSSDSESENSQGGKSKNYKKYVFASPHQRWEVAMALSEVHFQQVSFVNSICTYKGGTHVNFFCDKITNYLLSVIEKKEKKIQIKAPQIKNNLWLFVNCKIVNPKFDGQTKETLTTKSSEFGSGFELDESFYKNVIKTGILEVCISMARTKENLNVMKQLNKGVKKDQKITGIPKLEDANNAGKTAKSHNCTLIITEGDSAKNLAMAGIEIVGRDNFGVYPIRGKLLNVREANNKKLINNAEIQNIIKIIGLTIGKSYEDNKNLRYGSITIMTDQDHDGSHIKGLIINFIEHFWPSLFQMNGFVKQFITPIVKLTKGKRVESFYTITDYKNFLKSLGPDAKKWEAKYYKGLGTSTDKEAQEYFRNIDNNQKDFNYIDEEDHESIRLAFAKEKANERKTWLSNFDPLTDNFDSNIQSVRYKEFVNKELIHFSNSDNIRSIPCLCDGFKPSERKVIFASFKRNLKKQIKVAQLVGYVSEHSAYHHGEMSLTGTIIGLAQNFVGSNNVNLLLPIGQFGTRDLGGKNHAAARYIFTALNKVTRHLFNENDDPLMKYINEENQIIEPNWYLPIIPTILVNGCSGIGSGWSTNIPCFSPLEIIENFKNKLNGISFIELVPYYKGFTGKIYESPDKSEKSYIIEGVYHWSVDENGKDVLEITDLPVGHWTRNYKEFLERSMGVEFKSKENKEKKDKDKKKKKKDDDSDSDDEESSKIPITVEDYKEYHTQNRVHFKIWLLENWTIEFKKNPEKLIAMFKLRKRKALTNMVLFNHEGKLARYKNIIDIMEEFYTIRLKYYDLRKEYLLSILKRDLEILSNKARFILAVVDNKLEIRKRKKVDIVQDLIKMQFTPMSTIKLMVKQANENKNKKIGGDDLNEIIEEDAENVENESEEEDENPFISNNNKITSKDFNYLLEMPLWSLTYERVVVIQEDKEKKQDELNELANTDSRKIWIKDLNNLAAVLKEIEIEEENDRIETNKLKEEAKKEGGKKRKNANPDKADKDGKKKEKKESTGGAENKKQKVNINNIKEIKEKVEKVDKDKPKKEEVKKEEVKVKQAVNVNPLVPAKPLKLTEDQINSLPLAERIKYRQSKYILIN